MKLILQYELLGVQFQQKQIHSFSTIKVAT